MARRRTDGLPTQVTSYVGRRHEESKVKRLLAETRLLTLTGPGGVGKTRLALHVAHRIRKTFPDGAFSVDLASVRKPQLLAKAVADALGVRDESARPAEVVLREYLADKTLLLVLDNCEHLLETCAELVAALLRSAPELRILATSREPLRVLGEQVFDVPPLSVPGPDHRISAEDLTTYEAAALLYDRAIAAAPGFTVSADDAVAMVRIAQRLDGLPLAIELAAARLTGLHPRQLLRRLDDVFGALGTGDEGGDGGGEDGPARRQTLRSVIDWSYRLCSPAERTLWARASVFSGSFDLAAVDAVCGPAGTQGGTVLDLVMGLLDKSILLREEHPRGVRYRMLDAIRQYGHERLGESGKQAELRRRHRDHYHGVALRMDREWYGPRQLQWFDRMRLEHPNIRLALDFSLTEPGQVQPGLETASALRTFWHSNGSLNEGLNWLERLLAADKEPTPARATAALTSVWLALFLNDPARARPALDEGLVLLARYEEPRNLALMAHVSGLAQVFSGDLPLAAALLGEALERYRAIGDQGGALTTLFYLASAATLMGDADRAMALIAECLALSESLGEEWARGWVLWTEGIMAWRQGDLRLATRVERESIERKQHFNDRMGIGQCIEVLAWVAAAEGEHRRAARLLGALRMIWRETGSSLYAVLDDLHEEVEGTLRRELGAEAFDAAAAEGAGLGYHEIVAYALEERPAPRAEEAEAGTVALDPLTPREREVAELVAQGLSNKRIAARLVISQRTAEGHVEHIMAKLGFNSRAQIAAWVTHQTASGGTGA